MKLKVKQEFRDKFNKSILYTPGQEIEIADQARCQDLIDRELCLVVEQKEAKTTKEVEQKSTKANSSNKKK